jgi:hypothetical protein
MRIIEIIDEIKNIFGSDEDIKEFCNEAYGQDVSIMTCDFQLKDVPIKNLPVIVISDCYEESENRRFLFSEQERSILIVCGILENDKEKAFYDIIKFKELIKQAVRKDPLLNGKASYSCIVKSKTPENITHPLYFKELTMYINYKAR